MLLFRPSKPLRNRFLRIFGHFRPLKPRIPLDRVDVFDVFTIFSSQSLFVLSSGLLLPIFRSPGHLLATSRAHFFWPEGEREISAAPLFIALASKFASDLPNGAQELAGRCPGDRKIGRRRPEERTKRLCEEKIVKPSKTSTLSSEMRGLSGREGPKILKNRLRSGLEGLKSSIVT